jgi:hypothetical protein
VSASDTYIFVIVFSQATKRPTTVMKHNNIPPPTQDVSLSFMISLILFGYPLLDNFLNNINEADTFGP